MCSTCDVLELYDDHIYVREGNRASKARVVMIEGVVIIEEKDQTLLILLLNSTSEMGWLTTTFS